MSTAAIYARQSLDRLGDSLAVTRQIDLCRKFVAERGWTITAEYVDNDRSATTGVERPQFEQLLASNAERIVVWHIDRLVRLTGDLERVIDLGADVHAVQAGHLDLSNPAGRAVARTVTAWATYEGEQKALRQKSANLQRAEAGIPHAGRRAFGYSRDGASLNEAEAVEVQRAADQLLGGASLRSIVKGMNERGATTTAGNPWKPTELRRLLSNPRHAGLRVYQGQVIGKGTWPAIIDEETHHALRAILSDPSRHKAGRPRRYLLTGLAKCGTCGGSIYGVTEARGPLYYCESRRHIARRSEDIDALVREVIVTRLSLPDAVEIFARPEEKDRAVELRIEQRSLRARLDGLAEAFGEGDIDRVSLRKGTARVKDRLQAVDQELAEVTRTPVLTDLLSAEDIGAAWDAQDIDTRRAVIQTLLEVVLHSPGRGARRFDPSTVTLTWREDAT